MAESRSRSRSPIREPKPKKQKTSGFKWKEKKSTDEAAQEEGRGLERGYRDRETNEKRRQHKDRGERNDPEEALRQHRDIEREPGARDKAPSHPTTEAQSTSAPPAPKPSNDVASKFGPKAIAKSNSKPSSDTAPQDNLTSTPAAPTTTTKKPKAPHPSISNEPMIIVNVNDRLGTKAAIPCLASDSIKNFKAMVAAHIGRQPHEIMLKRQGERPFKDQLSLEDYGVSNGVQLDLELDTGD